MATVTDKRAPWDEAVAALADEVAALRAELARLREPEDPPRAPWRYGDPVEDEPEAPAPAFAVGDRVRDTARDERDEAERQRDRCAHTADRARAEADALRAQVERLTRERDAYKRAKAENDERFQCEAGEQRTRAESAERARDEAVRVAGEACGVLITLSWAVSHGLRGMGVAADAETHGLRDIPKRADAEVARLSAELAALTAPRSAAAWDEGLPAEVAALARSIADPDKDGVLSGGVDFGIGRRWYLEWCSADDLGEDWARIVVARSGDVVCVLRVAPDGMITREVQP